eukprot:scaffold160124_cov60-Cyclotella_meneghiniana.AAC.3
MLTRLVSSRISLCRAASHPSNAIKSLTLLSQSPTSFTPYHPAPPHNHQRHLSSSSDNNKDDENNNDDKDQSKLEMIRNWMKWDRWKYKPDMEAISNIGKGVSPLDAFRDTVPREKREAEPVGRSWTVKELRRKSYDDLHKYVLYKERNMLLTESNLSRRHGYSMVQPERRKKVRKSMGAIKHVLGERKRKKIADHRAYLAELEKFDGLMAELKLKGNDNDSNAATMEDQREDAMHTEAKDMKLDKVD